MADQRSGNGGIGGWPMKRVLSLLGALAIFAAVLVAGGSGQRVSVASAAGEGCPNSAFRNGPSAALPDCRAYEMVSPVDKNDSDVTTLVSMGGLRTSLLQASPDGNKLSYSAYKAFGDSPSSLYSNQYVATRSTGGWATHSINPPRQFSIFFEPPSGIISWYDLDIQVKALSQDLSTAIVTDDSKPVLTPDAIEGMPNLYSRNTATDAYDWIAGLADPSPPFWNEALLKGFEPLIQAVSDNGDQVVFTSSLKLTPNALPVSPNIHRQLYDYSGGEVHLVSVLPDGTPVAGAAAGNFENSNLDDNEKQFTQGSLSRDGSRITWTTRGTAGAPSEAGPAVIFQRVDNTETKLVSDLTRKAEVQEVEVDAEGGTFTLTVAPPFFASQQTTAPIAENATAQAVQEALEALSNVEPGEVSVTGPAGGPYVITFGGRYLNRNVPQMTANGSGLTGGASTVTVTTTQEGTGSSEYMGASADGEEVLYTQEEGNPNTGGVANLYRVNVEDETAELITSLSLFEANVQGVVGASDDLSYIYFVSRNVLDSGAVAGKPNLYLFHNGTDRFIATIAAEQTSILNRIPRSQAARVTPDGLGLAFQSRASLTGYDNRDVKNEERDIEVFVYDAASDELICASCNPSGARPDGRPLLKPDNGPEDPLLEAGKEVWAAAWLKTVENETHYPRVLSDDGNRVFFNAFDSLALGDNNSQQDVYQWEAQGTGSCEQAGGCVSLISTGESPKLSEFVDASASGDNVFFTTGSSIAPQDPGLLDIYNARVDGGIDPPPPPPSPCEGDSCQPLPVAPNDPTPASAAYDGPGNVHETLKKKKHRKHKRKHHQRHHRNHGGSGARHATHRNG